MTNVTFVDHSTVTLYKSDASDLDVCRAAWASTSKDSKDKGDSPERIEGLINFLVREGHHSTLEHCHMTFVVDTPLFVARQTMRTRTAAYNESSARYTTVEPRFYIPPIHERPLQQSGKVGAYTFTEGTAEQKVLTRSRLENGAQRAWDDYEALLRMGVAKEVARNALPVSMMTKFWMTINIRNLMHFIDLRTSAHAQYEVRQVAYQMEAEFEKAMPLTHAAYKKYGL